MAFDFKKEFKEFYLPKNTPALITVPSMHFIAVEGRGDPNEEGGEYQKALNILYSLAYTIKMSKKSDRRIEGYFDYVVPPLEGFWWQEGSDRVDYRDKIGFCWVSVIRLPDFVTEEDFAWAVEEAARKKKSDFSPARFLTMEEGLCVQLMHHGSYDTEAASVELMDAYIASQGYQNDFSATRRHHEIYLSDPRKTAPDKLKTVIRHPIRPL